MNAINDLGRWLYAHSRLYRHAEDNLQTYGRRELRWLYALVTLLGLVAGVAFARWLIDALDTPQGGTR